MVKDMVFEVE